MAPKLRGQGPRTFISYAFGNDLAPRLARGLTEAGFQVTLVDDRSLLGRPSLGAALDELIRAAEVVIPVLDRKANASRWVLHELEAAANYQRPLFPVVQEVDDLPGLVQDVPYLTEQNLDALAPSILIMMTSFTRIVVVLSLVRNALGVQAIPPNQVLVGLAMFLSLFVMAPVLSQINDDALQPYLDGEVTQSVALKRAEGPIKEFMLANTRSSDLDLMLSLQGGERPEQPEDTSLVALIPAFVISELKSAFIIGIVVFVPFVILDLVVSAVLMSLGMMMLPPVFVSLPLKLLLFVMVNGWGLTVQSLVANYKGVT